MKRLLAVIGFVFLIGCTDPNGAKSFLKSQGYTEIQIGGYDYLLSSKGEVSTTHFRARNVAGNIVEGAVGHTIGIFGLGSRWSIKVSGF